MTINIYNNDIKTSVNSLLHEISPERDYKEQTDYISEELDKFNELFNELSETAQNEHKYNLNWVYENAQSKFEQLLCEKIEKQLERKKKHNLDIKIIEEYSVILKRRKRIEKHLKIKFKMFSFMSSLVTVIDMVLSLLLVLVISEISHKGELYLSSEILSGMFVFFFALLKVTLEKYFIAPKVEKFGWKLYKNSINQYKKTLICITAIMLVISEGMINDIGASKLIKILRRGNKIMRKAKVS